MDADEAVRRFEERNAGDDDQPTVEQVAEKLGVRPETVQLPPAMKRAVVLFEDADGNFGTMPVEGIEMAAEDTLGLVARVLLRGVIILTAQEAAQRTLAGARPSVRVAPRGMVPTAPTIRGDQ